MRFPWSFDPAVPMRKEELVKVEQISIFLENKSGRLAEVTDILARNGINLRALSLADTADFGIFRLIVNDLEKAVTLLKDNGFTVAKNEVVAVEVPDRPGGLAGILAALQGKSINVEYMYAFVQKSEGNAVLIFRFDDIEKAIDALQKAGCQDLDAVKQYRDCRIIPCLSRDIFLRRRKRTMKLLKLAAIAACVIALSITPALAADTIKVGAILSVTGPASFLGAPEAKTLEMIVEDINAKGGINGTKVELVVKDSGGSPEKAVSFAKQLIDEDKVFAIIGPSTSGETMAIKNIAEEGKTILLSCAAAEVIVNPVAKYVFKTPQMDKHAVIRIFQQMKKMGITKVGVLSSNTGFGKAGKEQLEKLAPENGIQIVISEVYDKAATDLTAEVTKIKAANVQAIVNWSIEPAQAIVIKNARHSFTLTKARKSTYYYAFPMELRSRCTNAEGGTREGRADIHIPREQIGPPCRGNRYPCQERDQLEGSLSGRYC